MAGFRNPTILLYIDRWVCKGSNHEERPEIAVRWTSAFNDGRSQCELRTAREPLFFR